MGLITSLQNHINSLKFLKFLKQKNNQNELVEMALKERGILFKLLQNVSPELIENQRPENSVLSKQEITKIIETELNIKFNQHFNFLSDVIFCASIGQVHKAQLKDGTVVAIKIQYPKVKSTITSQLNLLRVAVIGSKISKISRWNFDIDSHIKTIQVRLHEELDYHHELKNLIEYSTNNPKNNIRPFTQYSSSLVLTQSWIEGIGLDLVKKKWTVGNKKTVANQIVEQYFEQVFITGFFQGDNNLTNFIVIKDPIETRWIDFGNWIHSTKELRQSLFTLIYKTTHKQEINFLGNFQTLGFDLQKLKYFQNLLPSLLEILFDPFLLDRPFDMSTWKLDERVNHLLGENKWWFRSSGDSSFLELMKSFFGLIKVIESIGVNINWYQHFMKITPFFNLNELEQDIPNIQNTIPQVTALAKQLVIQIFKDSKEHIKIELPAGSFFDLENLIPEDIKLKLMERSISISEIKHKYLEQGLVPGQVISLNDNLTTFNIYLI
jgi:predicted unusual protein kinase regulating ubiquinone biosynthesis (AarF/ABC1/UbiB family)